LYSFKIYTGIGFNINVKYSFGKGMSFHSFNFGYSLISRHPDNIIIPENYNLLNNRYRQIKSLIIDFNYSYLRKLDVDFATIYISGNFLSSINKTYNSELEWLYFAIGPGFHILKNIKKSSLNVGITFPIASCTLRNSYYILGAQTYDQNEHNFNLKDILNLNFFPKSLMIYTTIEYKHSLAKKFIILANYNFRYLRIKYPRMLEGIFTNYNIGCSFIL
jgi:hypothetical protein